MPNDLHKEKAQSVNKFKPNLKKHKLMIQTDKTGIQ